MSAPVHQLDRYAQIGDLAGIVRTLLAKSLVPLTVLLSLEFAILWFSGHPGTLCFGWLSIGSLLVLTVWRHGGVGLPVIPLLAVENLLVYGVPIAVSNPVVMSYGEADLIDAGIEIFVFSAALTAAWRFGMAAFGFSSPRCFALQGFNDEKMVKLSRLGFRLAVAATIYSLLASLQLLSVVLDLLPTGSNSVITAVMSGVIACGFFLSAMMLGRGAMGTWQRACFWVMLWLNAYIAAGGFLLSTTTTLFFSVIIGLFWSTGRVPWRFVTAVALILSFLNLGKFEMRQRHWRIADEEAFVETNFQNMPAAYQEWIAASFDVLVGAENNTYQGFNDTTAFRELGPTKKSGQNVLDRVNNLQNILFVIEAMNRANIAPLDGATYRIIPPLLLPRIIWPDKPRSHEGQVMLNVHFGRQDLNSTFQTYIAWGLQAEAYGNFGPIWGNIALGLVLGLLFAWVEKYVAHKLLLSMEGFLSFVLFLGMANSFEMVSSVLVTSLFQAFIPIIVASRPFVERVVPHRLSPT